jgi:capsular polysaccharide biosynthesis protein
MNEDNKDDFELDLNELFTILWTKKYLISLFILIFAAISIVYALSVPNIYTSKALLAPTDKNNSSITSKIGQYSSLAGMAGISLPGDTGNTSTEAMARIQSFNFFLDHFLPNIKLENLLAVKEWDKQKNLLVYDNNIFNPISNQWADKSMASSQQAFSEYKNIISISENNRSSYVSISVEHKSPLVAKRWLDIIITNINESMRNENKKIATSSVDFLNATLETTNIKEIRDVISQLLESQMQNLMLTSASESYVYKILDSPIAPERKSSPNRFFIVLFGTFIGFFIGVFISFIIHYKSER